MSADLIALTQWFNNHEFDNVDEMQGAFLAIQQLRALSARPKEAAPSEEQMRKVLREALETFSRYTCLNEVGQSNMEEEANEVLANIESVLAATQAPQEGENGE